MYLNVNNAQLEQELKIKTQDVVQIHATLMPENIF